MFVALQKGESVTKTVRAAVANASMKNAVRQWGKSVRKVTSVVSVSVLPKRIYVALITVQLVRITQTVAPEHVQTAFVVPG
jgi:hypothetical protein